MVMLFVIYNAEKYKMRCADTAISDVLFLYNYKSCVTHEYVFHPFVT